MRINFLFISLLLILPCSMGAQSAGFNTAKNTDIYFSILREVALYYVDSIQTDKLVKRSIEGMLDELDPYTEYVPEEASAAFDFVTTGIYGGIGALIRKSEGGIQISDPYQNYPADKAGLVPGDIILEIDGKPTKPMNVEAASNQLKGLAGSTLTLKVHKVRTRDTLNLQLVRERIHISDVHYSSILKDSVGYINLNAFTQNGSNDFAKSFQELKKTGKMKSLIIDLRSNGGGLLEEAVNIVGMFVPRNTTVVEARGRIKNFNAKYITQQEPLDTEIPLVVLVNNMSASSSEIVAGALQDLDRGVIIGTRTFGKGLVQSVRNLDYNAKLKITTAKYYTPSGRCVQIVDYSHRREDGSVGTIPDSLIKAFKTKNGRTVYDGGGIIPDITINPPVYHKISYSIAARDLMRSFAIQYSIKHPQIINPEVFRLTDEEYNDFTNYLLDKDFDDKTESELLLNKLITSAKTDQIYDTVKTELETLQQKIAGDRKNTLMQFKPELKELLEEEISSIYYYQQGRLRNILPNDEQVNKAIETLKNPEAYKKILGN